MKVLSVDRKILLEIDKNTFYLITEHHDPVTKSHKISVNIWDDKLNEIDKKEHTYKNKWEIFRAVNDPVAQNIKKAILDVKLFGLVA